MTLLSVEVLRALWPVKRTTRLGERNAVPVKYGFMDYAHAAYCTSHYSCIAIEQL